MGINHVLYDRPDLYQAQQARRALYIDGSLPNANVGAAYEGRLQIHNAVGDCTVTLVSGTLPPGYSLTVDNVAQQVVLNWPSYQTSNFTLNNDFSAWNGWQAEAGFTLDSGGARYDGFGEAGIYSPFYPVTAGTSTTLSINADCGTSGKEYVGFRSVISWYGASYDYLYIPGVQDAANDIHTAGPIIFSPNTTYVPSAVTANVPSVAVYARAYASCTRNRQNNPMWVNDASWTFQTSSVGTDTVGTISLCLSVTDSAGRTAGWCGSVVVGSVTPVFATLDPAAVYAGKIFLSGGNLTFNESGTGIGQDYGIICNTPRTSGKIYYELTVACSSGTQNRVSYGATTADAAFCAANEVNIGGVSGGSSPYVGVGVFANGNYSTGYSVVSTPLFASCVRGDILQFKFDIDGGMLYVAKNGGTFLTVTTGGALPSGKTWYAVGISFEGGYNPPQGGTFNFGATAFTYAVPSGYSSGWTT